MSTVIQAYRFALDPDAAQWQALASHCGGQRFAYNWGLARVRANLAQRAAERSYGVAEEALTPAVSWSAYALRKEFNRVKDTVAPWWQANSKEVYACGLANLATALGNWHDSRTGRRAGKAVRFPQFKGKRGTWSCRFTTGAFGLGEADRRHVLLPRIGLVRTHESTRKLARHVEAGRARIRSVTVSWRHGRWQCSFSVQISKPDPAPATGGGTVGVDLGVKHLAVLSTGETIANPKHLETRQRQLRRLQRKAARQQGPNRASGQAPSRRWRRTQAKIARLHTAIANARADGLHKLSTRLAAEFDTVVIEDLHVAGMVRNRCLARAVSGLGLGELRRQITYKTAWSQRRLMVANRWYPSSKTCSDCGVVKTKLRLSTRLFRCDVCGLCLDRDLNAARNLAALADAVAEGASTASRAGTLNTPAGNPTKTATPAGVQGTGYRHGKTAPTGAANVA